MRATLLLPWESDVGREPSKRAGEAGSPLDLTGICKKKKNSFGPSRAFGEKNVFH